MAAPVCHVSPNQVIQQPPGRALPTVVKATDLPSALTAIQQLTQIINILTGQQPYVPPYRSDGPTQFPETQFNIRPPQKPQGKARWIEVSRSTAKVRVYNPQDRSQYVDIDRINALSMVDNITGEVWFWERERGG